MLRMQALASLFKKCLGVVPKTPLAVPHVPLRRRYAPRLLPSVADNGTISNI